MRGSGSMHRCIAVSLFSSGQVLSLPETVQEKSTFRAMALRRELVNSRRRDFARNVDFSFIVSGSERTFPFRVSLNTLPTLRAGARTLIGGCIFMYSGSARLVSFVIKLISKGHNPNT